MQKISTYLYPNRIELLADLAGFPVEYTNVYQRTVKIYNGIDNTIEFDIKNADQKRIDLDDLTTIELNVMDTSGTALPNSPYTVTPLDQATKKGLAYVTIPQEDLVDLADQFLKYSVSAVKDSRDVMLYADSRFGAVGKMELVGSAMPVFRDPKTYTARNGEIDGAGNVINHFSPVPATFYEAVTTAQLRFDISVTGFIGTVWLEGTKDTTISVDSFKHAARLRSQTLSVATTTTITFNNVNIADFKYFRVSFQGDHPDTPTGTVDKVIVE